MDWSDFPARTWKAATPLYRIHREGREPAWFNATGEMRFDPPAAHGDDFGTCYTATSAIAAYVEVLGRFRALVPAHVIEGRRLAVLSCRKNLRLADLTDPSILGRYGVDGSISMSSRDDYDEPQQVAGELWSAGFNGIFFRVRHDPSMKLEGVALFNKPGETRTMFRAPRSARIPSDLIEEGRSVYGIEVERTMRSSWSLM